jgi:TonB family protein
MKEENKHIIYTAEDIKRYITGEMSAGEMHAIEMAALDDPLLAEAMEGYELMEQKDWSRELAALQNNFTQEKKEQAPVVSITQSKTFKWWKAAAAVLVLGTAATTAYLFTGKSTDTPAQEIAKLETTTVLSDTAGTLQQTDSATAFANITAADSSSKLTTFNNISTTGTFAYTIPPAAATQTENLKNAADSVFVYRPDATSGNLIAMNDDKASAGKLEVAEEKDYKAPVNNEYAENAAANNAVAQNSNAGNYEGFSKQNAEMNVVALDKKARAANNNNAYYQIQNTFSGQVLGTDNEPIGYANIKIDGTKKYIHTDANGNFKVTMPDSALHITVVSAGYTAKKYNLNNSGLVNKIILEPQPVTTESIAVAKNAAVAKRQKAVVDSTLLDEEEDAEPEGGWTKYNNYLSNNLRFPEDARQKNIHGEVEVTVKLSKNGDVSQVSVDKPLCTGCDAEAVRLVKEGPKWDVKNTKKKKVKVKVRF